MRFRLTAVFSGAALVAAAAFAQSPPALGSAAGFALLGGSGLTNSGNTTIAGDAGTSPGRSVGGLGSSSFTVGGLHVDDALARQAQRDSLSAYLELSARACVPLSGSVLAPGVYCVSQPLGGTLTLDGDGVWIFEVPDALTVNANSVIQGVHGAQDRNVFWRVGGSVSLGANAIFLGTVLATGDITAGRGAAVSGRLLTQRGAVSLDGNRISVCCEPFSFSRSSFPDGRAGTPYSEATAVSGGFGPYTFSVTAGSLPPGLQLSPGGVASGTPTAAGTYAFAITAVDAHGCSSTRTYAIAIAPCPIAITSPAPAGATVGVFYRYELTASGGTGPYTFTILSGALPEGLSPSSDGIIEGTPTRPGCRTFTVVVTDASGGCSATQTVTLCVACGALLIAPDPLPDGSAGVPYHQQLKGDGAIGPYTFALAGGSVPNGISPDGVIDFVPSKPGKFSFSVTMTDTVSGCAVTKPLTITIPCAGGITITPPVLPAGTVGTLYQQKLAANGGTPPYAFDAAPETLPGGLSLIADEITGIASKATCTTFTVTVTDAAGCTASITYTVCFTCPKVVFSPASLPLGIVNVPYGTVTLSASPGTGFKFEQTAGSLPNDMTLLSDGRIVGTPLVTGTFTFTVTATAGDCSASRDYTVVIIAPLPPSTGDAPSLSPWGRVLLALFLSAAGAIAIRGLQP